MNTKLDNITTQYRKFNESQALTEGQLNEFIDFFEDQDRLSRTRLSGVGVVCGFKSTLNAQGGITITQGAGVTTDGDLVTLRNKIADSKDSSISIDSKNYTYYRNFTDRVGYPYFLNNSNAQISLLELFTNEERQALIANGEESSSFLSIDQSAISTKVAILYLESYSNEDTPCEEADCDNNGAEQVSNLKILLANPADVDAYVINGRQKDNIFSLYNSYEVLYNGLKDIEVPRVILNSTISTKLAVRTKFQDAIQTPIIVADLVEGFSKIAAAFNITMNLGNESLADRMSRLLDTSSDDYQYRYDLLKDLVDTYNEIRRLLLHLKAICCPSITSFPKHLLLGQVGAPLNLGDHTLNRHDFYNSPVTTDADENQQRLLLLANRFVQKINNFQTFNGAIKITPSNQNVPLGKRAIPFYYSVTQDLLKKWNFERTQTGKEAYNLSYHTGNLSATGYVQSPLLYNIDDYDFYRIEGHIGMPYKIALQNINDLKTLYGLAFDVVPLVLQKGTSSSTTVSTSVVSGLTAAAVSIKDLRADLGNISRSVSNLSLDTQTTLRTISILDEKIRLLNNIELASDSEISLVKQSTKEDDVVAELLSDLLERNSGLEHFAGVPKGGTFYLIYASEDSNEVIADFAMPYLCCSKKDPVFLVLPATHLCHNDAKIPITILPLDGEVKAYVGTTQITAVTQTGGQNYFDPTLVTAQNLDKTITFTVNDDPVDTQMIVYAQPSATVVVDEPVYGEDPDVPEAEVTFNISGSGLTYVLNYGDGKSRSGNVPAQVSNTYQLVSGQEDVFNPILTVTNGNGCSTQYNLQPITLVGQSTVQCLSSMEVTVQYNQRTGPCPGGHTCDSARFNLMANGVNLGIVNLNNATETLQTGQLRPNNETSGPNRISTISITPEQAEQIAAANQPNDGFISFSLVCADSYCHTGVAWTTLTLNGLVIYSDCPTNNFLTINPCTGEVRS